MITKYRLVGSHCQGEDNMAGKESCPCVCVCVCLFSCLPPTTQPDTTSPEESSRPCNDHSLAKGREVRIGRLWEREREALDSLGRTTDSSRVLVWGECHFLVRFLLFFGTFWSILVRFLVFFGKIEADLVLFYMYSYWQLFFSSESLFGTFCPTYWYVFFCYLVLLALYWYVLVFFWYGWSRFGTFCHI